MPTQLRDQNAMTAAESQTLTSPTATTTACAECAEPFPADALNAVGRGTDVCDGCLDAHYRQCEDCADTYRADQLNSVNGGAAEVCDGCDRNYADCYDCDERRRDVEPRTVDGFTRPRCESCYDAYPYCDRCDEVVTDDHFYDCYEDEDEDEDEPDDHHVGFQFHDLVDGREVRTFDAQDGVLYFGFELEAESMGNGFAMFHDGSMALPYLSWKGDGSLANGMEMVSNPMTFAFFQQEAPRILDRWKLLRTAGWRSYNTRTCGMHIHAARTAFSELELYKVFTFVYGNRSFMERLSQRQEVQLNQWASLTNENPTREKLVRKARAFGNLGAGRYCAVNTENSCTIEFRLFRGTLDPDAFCKNIEFVVALHAFVQAVPLSSVTVPEFCAFVAEQAATYPHLHAFIEAKGLATVVGPALPER